jgi:alkylation response protein AidB-like acyl-CoA dehydrogenase
MNHNLASGIWPNVEHFFPLKVIEELSELSVSADKEGTLSESGLTILRRIGWPGLSVPKIFGGLGANLVECCAVQRKLGGADPGLAIAGSMHLGSVGVWNEHYRSHHDMSWVFMEAVATQKLIVASAIAEPTLGGSVTRSTLRAKKTEGGWEVSGRKSPLSFSAYADLITLQMQTEPVDNIPSEVLVALVPISIPGISSQLTWNTMGMRGSGSDTLLFDRCIIPDELIVFRGKPGVAEEDNMVAGIIWFCLVLTATYLGLVESVVGISSDLLNRMQISHLGASRSQLPSFQGVIGEQISALLTLELACAGLAKQMDEQTSPKLLLSPALALKQHAVRLIPEILGSIVETCGGIAYSRTIQLERFWRDAQAIRFHPPTPLPVAQFLGRQALGIPSSLDLDESSPSLQSENYLGV